MNYSIDDLKAFCAVVRLGRFSEAADALSITPSALSRRVANIEGRLGGHLFTRTTRKVTLTSAGAELYAKVLPLLSKLDSSLEEAARTIKGQSGTLTIAMVATFTASALPDILASFEAAHPHVMLYVRDGTASNVINLVEQGQADFGITTQLTFGPAIQAASIGTYDFCLLIAPERRAATGIGDAVAWRDLADMPVVGLNPLSSTRQQIDGELSGKGISVPWRIEVEQLSTIVSLVRSGRYVSVLPTSFDADANGIDAVPVGSPTIRRELFLVTRKDADLPPHAWHFIELAKQLGPSFITRK